MGNELNKMTAVEWFIEQLEEKGVAYENVSFRKIQISIDTSDYLKLIKQAKQMEKEQIITAIDETLKGVKLDEDKTGFIAMWGEGYYKKTYGGNNGK
jgi:hypothetical protein